jgi:hypothetical protein
VHTYTCVANVTLSIDQETLRRARRRADALGSSVNQVIRDHLAEFAGESTAEEDAAVFECLSRASQGHSQGWKFNREELHERR